MNVLGGAEKPHFYNIVEGVAITGKAAYEDALSSGVDPTDIVPLADVLSGESKPLNQVDRLHVDDWQRSDHISWGKWLLGAASVRLTRQVMYNAYEAGLGPEPQRIYLKSRNAAEPHFKNISHFYQEIGADQSLKKYEYDHWTFGELIQRIKTLADEMAEQGLRPTVEQFDKLAQQGLCPRPERMTRRLTGWTFGELIDMTGYPQVQTWDDDRFLEWGIKFTEANGRLPYGGGIIAIARRFRGPSERTIANKYGGILAYQNKVIEVYEAQQKQKSEERRKKLDVIELAQEHGELPECVADQSDQASMIQIAARVWLLQALLPDLSLTQQDSAARLESTSAFLARIRQHGRHLTPAHIEVMASQIGVFDDIWPPDDSYLEYLQV